MVTSMKEVLVSWTVLSSTLMSGLSCFSPSVTILYASWQNWKVCGLVRFSTFS